MIFRLSVIFPAYLAVYVFSYYAAYLLRFDFALPSNQQELFWKSLPVVLLVKCVNSIAFGEWRRTFRYATINDIVPLVASATASGGILLAVNPWLFSDPWIARPVIVVDWVLSILLSALLRCAARMYREAIRPFFFPQTKRRTLVYGADRNGISILQALQVTHSDYQVVGFIDPSSSKKQELVAGVPVFPTASGWAKLAKSTRAGHVLIPGSVSGKTVREIVKECDDAGMKTHVIPSVHEIVNGRFKLKIRDVTINDLLRREPARLDMRAIRSYVAGRRVLVTGGAGSIGSELCRQILALRPETLIVLDQSEFGAFQLQQELVTKCDSSIPLVFVIADVTNASTVERIMRKHEPELVFHAAAYKHVPLMEENPHEAIRNNVFGTKTVIDAAAAQGVERFVLISTDKAVRPSSVMGATKLIAEKYLQTMAEQSQTRFITVRFGNVLNSQGSVVPTFRQQIQRGGPVTVTHPEMTRFFMTIPEAVQLVLQAGAIGSSGDVLILDMGESVKIFDLAKDMILLSGLRFPEDIDIVFTGIRPGEKLYEELHYQSEARGKQVHEKISCAHPHAVPYAQIRIDLNTLQSALVGSTKDVLHALNQLIDRYAADAHPQPIDLRKAA